MSKGSTQAGTTTQTQTTAPYMYPYMGTALGQAGNLLQSGGPQVYSGQRVADFNPVQNQAFSNTNNLDNTLTQGNGNPYENSMFNQAALATQGQLGSEFAGSGRNLDASMPLRSDQLNNLATNFYGNNYQNTVQNAMGAANQQQQLGGTIQNQAQNQINASMGAFNQAQQRPYANLSQFEQYLQGVQPGAQTQSPYYQNKGANTLGTAVAGQQLYNGYNNKGSSGGSTGDAYSGGFTS
jgi:hypothetical protein